jgi:ubiquinone/menaquinone biosynthesis C-methylase UbiE
VAASSPIKATTISREYLEEVIRRDSRTDGDYAARRVADKLGKLRAPQAGDAILDVGCGTGGITAAFSRMGLRAVGIDVVPEFIQFARSRYEEPEFAVRAAEDLGFADESFDFVTLVSVIEHVTDWRKALGEAARVLKEGGVLYLRTSNRLWPLQGEIDYFPGFPYLPRSLQGRIYQLAMRYEPRLVGYTDRPAYHWLTWWQLARELRGLGLEPYRWLELVDDSDVPRAYARYRPAIMAILRFPIPLYSFLPDANQVVAEKKRRA